LETISRLKNTVFEMVDVEAFLKKIGVGIRPMNDPFFDESYKVCKVFTCKGVIAEDEEELCHTQ
jgi:hypothetical protein